MSKKQYDALVKYQAAARAAKEKADNARRVYNSEAAAEELNRIQAQLEQERQQAVDSIYADRNERLSQVEEWATVSGESITEDAKLLQYGVVGQDLFAELVDRYKNNATMSQILLNYGNKFNADLRRDNNEAFPEGLLEIENIPTKEKKTEEVEHSTNSALGVLNMIDNGFTGYGGGTDSPMVDMAIRSMQDA